VYRYKQPFRDGSTHVVLEPLLMPKILGHVQRREAAATMQARAPAAGSRQTRILTQTGWVVSRGWFSAAGQVLGNHGSLSTSQMPSSVTFSAKWVRARVLTGPLILAWMEEYLGYTSYPPGVLITD
jgi:hypothetical protein